MDNNYTNQEINNQAIKNQEIESQEIEGQEITSQEITSHGVEALEMACQEMPCQEIPGQKMPSQKIPGQKMPCQETTMPENARPENSRQENSRQGMTVRKYANENKSSCIVLKNKHKNASSEKYKDYFNELQKAGKIINSAYDDSLWICFEDKDSPTRQLFFAFLENHSEIMEDVKNCLLVKLYEQKDKPATVKKRLAHIRHFMKETGFMDPDNAKNYQMSITAWNNEKKREAISIREFLAFSNLENAGIYYDIVKDVKKEADNYRKLPNFPSVLLFDHIVNDYWERVKDAEDSNDKYRLFPVILWWKLTTVIPTRPVEFFNLKRDCLTEEDGKYFLHMQRLKTTEGKQRAVSDIVTRFQINKELYSLINDYVEYCNGIDKCEYLISPPTCDMIYRGKVFNTRQKFTNEKMNKYYHAFQKEVLEEKYGYIMVRSQVRGQETSDDITMEDVFRDGEISYIHYGDTRHLAIMNMMLQGINPIYIKQLAGHHTLDAQVGYFSHLETFATAKTYLLSMHMKMSIKKKHMLTHPQGTVGKGEKVIEKKLMGWGYYNLPKVANGQGRCGSKNIPYECCNNGAYKGCLFCKHFFPENVSADTLDICKEENDRNIELVKKSMIDLFGQVNLIDDKELGQNALKLGVLLNQKAIIDAYHKLSLENTNLENTSLEHKNIKNTNLENTDLENINMEEIL